MATFTNTTKNSTTWKNIIMHGKATLLNDLANFTFEDVIFEDGTKLQDVTFSELVAQVWNNVSKNSANSWTNQTKN